MGCLRRTARPFAQWCTPRRENLHTECDICLPARGEGGQYLLPISEQPHQILLGAAVGCSIALHASHGDLLTVPSVCTALQSGAGAGLTHPQRLFVHRHPRWAPAWGHAMGLIDRR